MELKIIVFHLGGSFLHKQIYGYDGALNADVYLPYLGTTARISEDIV